METKSEYNRELDYIFADKRRASVDIGDDDEDRVLSLILSLGSSFPSEIARKLLLTVEQVNVIITRLINKELLISIIPEHWHPQPLIRVRIAEMRAQGIHTYEQFILRSWYIATEKGFWHIADNYSGKQKRANTAYIETYPNIKYFDDFKT